MCRGGLGCSSNPFSSPRPSPPSQPVSRTLPTLSPSIPTALHSRFGNLCPSEVWQSGSLIREVAALRVLLGGWRWGTPPAPPLLEGMGQQDLLLHPSLTQHLAMGLLHSSIPQNIHPSSSHGKPRGVMVPSHLCPITGVTPENQNIHRSAGKAINYSTTFINTGIFTVHSLLVAVTMENGRGGARAELPPEKKKLKDGMKERERNVAEGEGEGKRRQRREHEGEK